MKAHFTITWNPHHPDETIIRKRSTFDKLLRIEKLDCLKDCAHYFNELYQETLTGKKGA